MMSTGIWPSWIKYRSSLTEYDNLLGLPDDQSDPYGDAWDALWIGHCGSLAGPEDDAYLPYLS